MQPFSAKSNAQPTDLLGRSNAPFVSGFSLHGCIFESIDLSSSMKPYHYEIWNFALLYAPVIIGYYCV